MVFQAPKAKHVLLCYEQQHVAAIYIERYLTFWRRIFFQILAHPVFKM